MLDNIYEIQLESIEEEIKNIAITTRQNVLLEMEENTKVPEMVKVFQHISKIKLV